MKRRYGILSLLIVSTAILAQCQNSITNPPTKAKELRPLTQTEQQIATSSQSFGVDVFRNVVANEQKGKNVFISPLSLSMALAMTVNGAAGDTRAAMMKTLDMSNSSMKDMNTSYQSLMKLLLNADPKVQMNLANSIWYRNTFQAQQNFISTCQSYFDAEVKGLNFSDSKSVDVINKWVSDKTNGHITNMVQPPIPGNIVMYLMNAIYFKGDWRHQFDKKKTKLEDFTLSDGTKVKPEMMNMETVMPYNQSSGTQVLDMAYGDSVFTMTVILPPAGTSIDDFVANLTRDKLDNWIGQLHNEKVNISIPKFKIDYTTDLNKVLSDMGMKVAFDPNNADFSNINPNEQLYISKVKQKSYVNVDEEGTEAAAATSVSIGVNAVISVPVFRADRPFVYLIRERSSGTILFIGKMENPTG
ncbi:MAG TPA: serpin family protein [Balneolales bacterium]|nr:serpin family protein [Balneolales bacterium]